jgi:hypothetical protein
VALADTTDWREFLAIRQDVLLRAMSLVEEAGTRLVVPVHVQLGARDAAVVEELSRAAATRVRQWREEGRLNVPEFSDPD